MKKTMGQIIAENRKAKGLTQLDLAEKLGITDKAVSKWERDLSCPDISALPQLAEILGISVEELMQIQKPEQEKEKKSFRKIADTALKGIALAMGIAVAVLNVMGELEMGEGLTMLGIGLACAAASMLSKE